MTRSDSDPGRGVMTAPNGSPPGGLSAVRVSPRADRVCRGAEFRGCRDLRDGLAPTAATAPAQSLTRGQRTGRSATQDGPAPARTRAPATTSPSRALHAGRPGRPPLMTARPGVVPTAAVPGLEPARRGTGRPREPALRVPLCPGDAARVAGHSRMPQRGQRTTSDALKKF